MKAIQCWVVSLSLLALTACSKSEVQSGQEAADLVNASATGVVKWSTVTNVESGDENVSFAGEIKNEAITAEVLENGLILVFSKTDAQVQTLPFQEKSNELRYWYYHASEGSVFIQANAPASPATVTTAQDFAVVVLNESLLEELESNGTSKDLLLSMSFDQVKTVLNQ